MYASKWYTRHTRCDMSHNDANMPYDAWQKRVAHAAYKMWHHTTCAICVHTHLSPRMPCNLCGCVSCCMPCVHTHTCLGLNSCLCVLSVACKCSCMPCVTPVLVYTCLPVLSVAYKCSCMPCVTPLLVKTSLVCHVSHLSWSKPLLYAMCHTCLGLHMSTCLVRHVFLKRLWCVV